MRFLQILAIALAVAMTVSTPAAHAKEPKLSIAARDGFSQQRAIIVTEPQATYVHWEYQYLDKHFPGRSMSGEHALIADEPHDRAWDLHTFMWRGRKTEVWFDITKQFRAFSKAHPEIK
jgi:hypothetical protein